jgi:hypothetical protein
MLHDLLGCRQEQRIVNMKSLAQEREHTRASQHREKPLCPRRRIKLQNSGCGRLTGLPRSEGSG